MNAVTFVIHSLLLSANAAIWLRNLKIIFNL
jgi:hypothetical protein